jgi:hypothetical protein
MTQQIINTGLVANDGTGESLRAAFDAVNNNFTAIWSSGPVDSNVVIANNTVTVRGYNNELILQANGIGNIQVNSTINPGISGVYDLGTPDKLFGSVRAQYFYGNGAFLTGISGGGGGSQVTFSQFAPNPANIGDVWIESDTGVQYIYFSDNTSNQWAEMEAYQSFSSSGGTYGNANVVANLAALGSNPVSTTGNVTAGYFLGNGSQLTGLAATYGNANVATFLAAFGSNTISTSGNVTAGYFLGNGSQLTGLASTYGNSNVATLLAGFGSNTISTTSNITGGNILTGGLISATGNVSGNYFIGNGSQLTGIAASYGNSNVATFLAAYGSNTVSTTGNITGGNLLTGGLISATGNVTGGNILGGANVNATTHTGTTVSVTGNITGGNVLTGGLISAAGNVTVGGNLSVTGNIIGNVATRFESSWTVPVGNSTQSFTVAASETYYLWVDCNIPNGILAWNATATVTNTNVPVVGAQYAWVYSGGGTPIDFTSIPNQFIGTANAIVRSSTAPSSTTNRFDFGINNTSAGNVTVRYGWVAIS